MKVIDRYVGAAAFGGIALAWLAILLLILALNFFGELRGAEGDYQALDAVWFVLLSVPSAAYRVFPIAAVIGALLGVGALAATNQLVALRTAGVSRLRVAVAASLGGLLLLLPVVLMGEFLAPAAEQQARAFRLAQKAGRVNLGGVGGFWLRDGSDIVNIRRASLLADRAQQSVSYADLQIYRFNDSGRLEAVLSADSAAHTDGAWVLQGVRQIDIHADSAELTEYPRLDWPSEVEPSLLDAAVSRPVYLSMRDLWNFIGYLSENGLDARAYKTAFWEKALYPISVIALILAGLPFLFGGGRNQNLGIRVFIGVVIAAVYVLFSRSLQNVGAAFGLSSILVVLLPPLALSALAVLGLRRGV